MQLREFDLKRAARPILLVPALVELPKCPDRRCGQTFIHAECEDRFRGALRCVRSSCRQRWFVEPLDAGSVRRQIELTYDDVAIAADLMIRLRLPERTDDPMFLQMPLTSELWQGYVNDRDVIPRNRTRRLLRALLSVARW